MNRSLLYTLLLILGLGFSQVTDHPILLAIGLQMMTICLAYIMIHLGLEFQFTFEKKQEYIKDYLISITTAILPWFFCCLYFIIFFQISWQESIAISKFAAPTSVAALFSLLEAAKLAKTWVYEKIRILTIFDDLNTIFLLIPVQIMLVGFSYKFVFVLVLTFMLLYLAYKYPNSLKIPCHSPLILLLYSLCIWTALFLFEKTTSLHFEILIPGFCFGRLLDSSNKHHITTAKIDLWIKGLLLFLVGFSINKIGLEGELSSIFCHVLAITLLSNLGKCFPIFCYKKQVPLRERIATSVGLFARGELGGGLLAVSAIYNLNDYAMMIAGLSLATNILLTGCFVKVVKKLVYS